MNSATQSTRFVGNRFLSRLANRRSIGRAVGVCVLSVAAFNAGGCNNAAEGGLSGAALGAGAGAIIGSLSGDAGTGAIIGAVAGGLGGAVIGDQNERARYAPAPQYSSQPVVYTSGYEYVPSRTVYVYPSSSVYIYGGGYRGGYCGDRGYRYCR